MAFACPILCKLRSTLWQRRIVAYLDGLYPSLRFGDLRQAKVNALPAHAPGRLQSTGGEELRQFFGRTLMSSVLDRAFKGEL